MTKTTMTILERLEVSVRQLGERSSSEPTQLDVIRRALNNFYMNVYKGRFSGASSYKMQKHPEYYQVGIEPPADAPDGEYSTYSGQIKETWEIPHRDDFEDDELEELSKHSDLYLSQSPREFYKQIDTVAERIVRDRERLDALIEGEYIRRSEFTLTQEEREELFYENLGPLFVELVELGYTIDELKS